MTFRLDDADRVVQAAWMFIEERPLVGPGTRLVLYRFQHTCGFVHDSLAPFVTTLCAQCKKPSPVGRP